MASNPYAAGKPVYRGTSSAATMGPVDPMGYKMRDAKAVARRNAILARLKAMQKGKYMSSAFLGGNK